jgi:hypothetical protein
MTAGPSYLKKCKRKSSLISILFYCISIPGFIGCAKIGTPTGGPKDELPPNVIECVPENKATTVESNTIEITFDEFILLKNLNEELTLSPPLKERPISRIRNKTLIVDLNNELKDSTTYTLNFGNAIADNNEGNLLPDYEFVFSTGAVIDSLSITGKVVNANSLKPEKEKIVVMLYDNLSDSAPYKDLPLYITKTSPEGKFAISNAKRGTYRLFALKDGNNNLRFDNPDEMIAFSDTAIILSPDLVQKVNFVKDTSIHKAKKELPVKTHGSNKDTIPADTVKWVFKELYARNVDLFLFKEEEMRQNIIDRDRERREMLRFVFNRPLFDSLQMTPLNFTNPKWYLQDISAGKDTVSIWITDSSVWQKDTISLALTYTVLDSSMNFISRTDTAVLKFRGKESKSGTSFRAKRKGSVADSAFLNLSSNIRKQSVVELNQPILINSPSPVGTFNINKIRLDRSEDTVYIPQGIHRVADTVALYSVKFSTPWVENTPYKLWIGPGAVTDIYGKTNDTIIISFRTQKSDYYGKIILTFDGPVFPVIIQLLDEKENNILEKYLSEKGQLIFDYLPPKKYRFKAIFDSNENKKWDTGKYLKHLQPEKVRYYPNPVDLRSNWDVDINWLIDD